MTSVPAHATVPGISVAPPPRTVLIVGPLAPPAGGMAGQTKQLCDLLSAEGCRVETVQVNAPYRPAWIANLRGARAVARLLPYAARLWRATRDADIVHVMANSGWAWHMFAAPAVWIAWSRGAPAIVNYRGGEAEAFLDRQSFWVRPTLARARAVVVPSAFLRDVFARFGVATEIVPNVVDPALFHPGAPTPGRRHLIVTRNLEDLYDVGTALRAFAALRTRHPGARITVAGTGPRAGELARLADDLGIGDAVAFSGRLSRDAMAALYREADVLLNPSLADNMPNSLLEAMASGVPIVSTGVGGIPLMVADGRTGLLVPPRDPAAMAAAANRVLDDPALAAALRDAGLAEARRYTWASVRERWFDVYARARDPAAARAAPLRGAR